MSLSLNYPTISPSLLLDFVNSNRVDPLVTFTRSSAATYFDETGTLQTAGNNVPRIDFDPSTLVCRGLLVEEQRTNLLLQSEDFATTWTATGSTVSVNAITAPSAATTADKLIADSAVTVSPSSVAAFVRQDITKAATATTYTFSVFAKADEFNAIRLFARDNATSANNAAVSALLTNGTVLTAAAAGGTFTNATVVITNAGSGWYRVALTFTSSTETAIRCIYAVNDSSTTTGDGTSGVYIWGAQLEVGAFATSVIPTTSTAVTRAADVASVNTLSPWYNAAEGTLFGEITDAAITVGGASRRIANINNGTENNRITVAWAGLTSVGAAFVSNGGITQAGFNSPSGAYPFPTKVALAYATNNFQAAVNGSAFAADTSGTVPSVDRMTLGDVVTGGSGPQNLNGHIQRIAYYPVRLPNAQLQALTA